MLCYVVLCYVMLCYVMLCYVMPYFSYLTEFNMMRDVMHLAKSNLVSFAEILRSLVRLL